MIRIPRTIATLVLVVAVVLGALAVGYAFRARLAETAIVGTVLDRIGRAETDPPDAPYWTCPMHPDVHERGPGVCPICGMTLTEVETSAADDPMAAMTNSGQTISGSSSVGTLRAEVNIDPRRQQLVGVRTAAVERRPLTMPIRARWDRALR